MCILEAAEGERDLVRSRGLGDGYKRKIKVLVADSEPHIDKGGREYRL